MKKIPTQMFVKLISSGVASLLAIVTFVLSFTSLGWFSANSQTPATGTDMRVEGSSAPEISAYTYLTGSEAEAVGGTEGWVPSSITNPTSFTPVIHQYNTAENGGAFVLSSLPFGTIDNLVRPKDDNTMYLRFAITPKEAGATFRLRIHSRSSETDGAGVTVYPFDLYDQENRPVAKTEQVYADVAGVIESDENGLELFKLQYAVTKDSDVLPGAFGDLVFDDVSGSEFPVEAEDAETYYLFVKLQPNATTFAHIAGFLYRYMPCVLIYDFEVEYIY